MIEHYGSMDLLGYAIHMMRLLTILSVLAGVSMAADKSADAVKTAEKAWASATVAGNEATLKLILADDLTYTHSTGETDAKAAFIGNLKGARKYHKLNHESMDVRLYGNTAVLTATAQVETSQNGGSVNSAHLRFIHLWVLQNGRWQLVAHQSLRLPN
jgi:ketosteroid isomerase-like protein